MGVSPVTEFPVFSQILSSHIESADKSDPSVYYDNLPVIAVIHSKLKLSEKRREELRDLYALLFQPLPVFVVHGPAAHTVEEHSHPYALPRLLDQHVFDLLPEFVIPDDVVLQMDIFPRLLHLFDQGTELLFSVRIDPDIVIVCEDRFSRLKIIKDQISESSHSRVDRYQPFLRDRLLLPPHGIFQLSFYLLCFKHPALMKILPDHKVQDKPEDRYKIKQKQPCPDSLRRPSLKENNDQRQNNIDDDQIIHDKMVGRHRSVPNRFCHK